MTTLCLTSEIKPIINELKNCIIKESENSGKIKISQDVINIKLKKFILDKLNILSDFNLNFFGGESTATIKIGIIPKKLTLHSINFMFSKNEYKFSLKHKNALFVNSFVSNMKLPEGIKIIGDTLYVDFIKLNSFKEMLFEIFSEFNMPNTTEILFVGCKDGFLTFSYKFTYKFI